MARRPEGGSDGFTWRVGGKGVDGKKVPMSRMVPGRGTEG